MRNLSNELFFEAHRGLKESPDKKYGLGMHWSTNEKIARGFSGGSKLKEHDPNAWRPEHISHPHTVIHAQVPMSSVETNTQVLGQRGVFDRKSDVGNFEKEVSVRPGAPVMVTGITKYRKIERPSQVPGTSKETQSKPRTRRYKTPRTMQA